MVLSDNQQALLVALCGGVVAALFRLSEERKKSGSSYDWVDFLLLSITASFSGVIGFLLARWQLEDPFLIMAVTGLVSIGGYPMLMALQKDAYLAIRNRALMSVPGLPQSTLAPSPSPTGPYSRQEPARAPYAAQNGPEPSQGYSIDDYDERVP